MTLLLSLGIIAHHEAQHSTLEDIIVMENGILVEIRRREKPGVDPLPSKDAAVATLFIQKYWRDIVAKWVDSFVYKRIVKTTKINDKL